MNEVRLQNRADTKYTFNIRSLGEILETASESYRLLTINNLSVQEYRTLYFDLPDLRFYFDHHKGLRSRYKVRFREYNHTGQVYLEIKEKNNRDKTVKERMLVKKIETDLSGESVQFIENFIKIDAKQLIPSIWTRFSRLTLVSEHEHQRITLDMNISFEGHSAKKELPYLVICEIKQERNYSQNRFSKILKSHRIYPYNISKYGIGTAILKPTIKQNRFKEKLITLNKLKNDTGSYYVAS